MIMSDSQPRVVALFQSHICKMPFAESGQNHGMESVLGFCLWRSSLWLRKICFLLIRMQSPESYCPDHPGCVDKALHSDPPQL
jgi:hypothetical protein